MPGAEPGRGNPQCQCRVGDEWIESSPAKKDLAMLVDKRNGHGMEKFVSSPESLSYPGLHPKNVTNRSKEVILSFTSTLMKPSL